jgi:hypothetical protein
MPTFSFYREWYWWILMLIVLASAYLQGVGSNLSSQTGVPRHRMAAMYAYSAAIRPFCWLGMLLLSGWVSVVASILATFIFTICIAGIMREHARLIVQQFLVAHSQRLDEKMKRCLRCGVIRSIGYFAVDDTTADGHVQTCVACHSPELWKSVQAMKSISGERE